jgi:Uri superfamily endonuclease
MDVEIGMSVSGTLSSVNLPSRAGTYILLLRLARPATLSIGRLGRYDLPTGLYAYCGSARGPGGLRARINRHLREEKSPHWHIDALTALAPVVELGWIESTERLECVWAQKLSALPHVWIPIPGFGSSDCACRAHLLALPQVRQDTIWQALGHPSRLAVP